MTKEMLNKMVAEIRTEVEGMKVAEMRKTASNYGVKNASKYKRVELVEKLVAQMTAVQKSMVEAEEETKAKAAKKANKAQKKQNNGDKRYKATKVENEDVEVLVHEILSATPAQVDEMDLYSVNRKVLIEVMKQLHCELWYRTYDKPTMIAKITVALGSAAEEE